MVNATTTTIITYICAEIACGFISITGNLIVLVAIITHKKLHSLKSLFISNLAVADIAVGIFVTPGIFFSNFGFPNDKFWCLFIHCVVIMFTNISILMLLVISIDRFIVIKFPLTYEKYATLTLANIINASVWTLGIASGLSPMLGRNIGQEEISRCSFTSVMSIEYLVYFQFYTLTLVPLTLMLLIYLSLCSAAKKQAGKTMRLESYIGVHQSPSRYRRRWEKDLQSTKMFATIFVLFAFLWLPLITLSSMEFFCKECQHPVEFFLVANVLSHANSSVHPFVYAAFSTRIRTAVNGILSSHKSLQQKKTRWK